MDSAYFLVCLVRDSNVCVCVSNVPILRPRLSEVELQELLPDQRNEWMVRGCGQGLTRPTIHLQPL